MTERSGFGRSALWTVVVVLVIAAAALWIASLLIWTWRVDITGGMAVARPLRGAESQPALAGLAVAVLAAVAAVLATGGWPRRAVGAMVAAGGVGALVVAVHGLLEPRIRSVGDIGFERWLGDIDRWSVESAVGIGLAALAGVLLVAGGTTVLVLGHRMPRMGSRYQQPAARRAARAPDRALWDDLDAGRDPTA